MKNKKNMCGRENQLAPPRGKSKILTTEPRFVVTKLHFFLIK